MTLSVGGAVLDDLTTSGTASTASYDVDDEATVKRDRSKRDQGGQGVPDAYVVEDKTFDTSRNDTRELNRDQRQNTQHPRR
ncbi:hypothetical protein DL95DRAFT_381590, partial [Leptodontidium sp. 2 PMI_412]